MNLDPDMLLRGTPYLNGDVDNPAAFLRVLKSSEKVAQRAQKYRRMLDSQTKQAQELIRGSERGKQVTESNRIEGYMWKQEDVRQTVKNSASLLDAPLRDLLRSVESDPRSFQVLGLYKAYEIADKWAHEDRSPSEVEILQLHQLITAGEQGAGAYRTHFGTRIKSQAHLPPDQLEVPKMMREFVDWWSATKIDPLLTATVIHAWFTHIHPFHDGNGRLARLLATISLVQAGYPPLIVSSEAERERYYDALAESDDGNILPLFELFAAIQTREAAILTRKDYVDAILQNTIYRDPGNRHKAWISFYQRFLADFESQIRGVGWEFYAFGTPTPEQFALLEDRDPAGNSWAAKIIDPLGNIWLMWFGFRSHIAMDELQSNLTPSLFFSPMDKLGNSGKPFRRRHENEGSEDGVPDEVFLVVAPSTKCLVRTGLDVKELSVGDTAQFLRTCIVAHQRKFL